MDTLYDKYYIIKNYYSIKIFGVYKKICRDIMFKHMSNQTKILVPIILLSIILVFIASLIIKPNFEHITQLKSLKERVSYSAVATSLLVAIQKERGLSYAYLTNHNNKFKLLLIEQRKNTDQQILKLKIKKYNFKDIKLKNEIHDTLKYLQNITKIRTKIDKISINKEKVLEEYTKTNEYLLKSIKNIIKYSNIPQITQDILSLSSFLYIQENLGLLRAKGSAIIIEKTPNVDEIIQYISSENIITEYEKNFLDISQPDISKKYKEIKKDNTFQQYKYYNKLITSNQIEKLNPIEWFNTLTKVINDFNIISIMIKFNTEKAIDQKLQDIKYTFALVSNLTLLSLVAFILMIISFLKLARDEQKLREVSDKYIISSITDTKGRIIDVSQAFCDISGFKKEELIGKPHNIVRHPDMPKEVFKELWEKISSGKPWSGKVKNLRKDGGYYWVYAHIEPLYDSKGNIDSYISIRLDITESEQLIEKIKQEEYKNKKTQELMQQQSRLAQMGEMISMIAHQWRQPLSAITATTGTLELKAKMNKLDKEDVELSAKKIREFSLHLSSTIDDFRNFFKTKKEKTLTSFEKIIESVKSIIDSTLSHNNIKLEVINKSNIDLYTYEGELKQVVLNLIKNAEDALIENEIKDPKITITIDENELSIHDNAGGIPEEIINKIFNPYFSTKVNKDGTGLGLYMSKTIVEEHCHGKLEVINEDNGAKFIITIPKA